MDSKEDKNKGDSANVSQFIESCFSTAGEIHKCISKKRDSFQSTSDLDAGYIRKNGILIGREIGIRRFVFESYDLFVLRGFLILAQGILEGLDNQFVQFTFRTLLEIGIKKVDVLFAKGVSEEHRNKFKLENTFSDWLELPEHYKDFLYLFSEEKDALNNNVKKFFEEADRNLRLKRTVDIKLVKSIKRQLNRNIGEYSADVEEFSFLNRSNLVFLEAAWSHLLHGNPFHIEAVLHLDAARLRNRTYAILLITLVNVLYRTKEYVDDRSIQAKISSLLDQADPVWNVLADDWKKRGTKEK
jgi:hypothetical protein